MGAYVPGNFFYRSKIQANVTRKEITEGWVFAEPKTQDSQLKKLLESLGKPTELCGLKINKQKSMSFPLRETKRSENETEGRPPLTTATPFKRLRINFMRQPRNFFEGRITFC